MLLFLRMFVLLIINLFALRILLRALGDVDYGIYTVLTGIATMLSCFGSVIASATQRFYSNADGRNDVASKKKIFSASINLSLAISAVFLILFETVGLWFVNTQLNIPAERMTTAVWVYQFAVFSFLNTFVQNPFMAAVIAREEMGLFTVISTAECLLKFAAAFILLYLLGDRLMLYGVGIYVVSLLVLCSYVFYCGRKYDECTYVNITDRKLYGELASFSGYTFYGSLASIGMIQGSTILLNIFFGPVINAAFAISLQINNAFSTLVNVVMLAVRPAMIRTYAEENHVYLNTLFSFSNKFLACVVLSFAIPLFVEMPDILDFWLGDYPEDSVMFSRIVLIYIFVFALQNPITTMIDATGQVKKYHLVAETIIICCPLVAWLCFRMGMPPQYSYYSMIAMLIVAHIPRLIILKEKYPQVSLLAYLFRFILPLTAVAVAAYISAETVHGTIDDALLRFISVSITCVLVLSILVFAIVLTPGENKMVRQYVALLCNKIRR